MEVWKIFLENGEFYGKITCFFTKKICIFVSL